MVCIGEQPRAPRLAAHIEALWRRAAAHPRSKFKSLWKNNHKILNRFDMKLYKDIKVIAPKILGNCGAAKSRSVPPALAKAEG